MRWALWMWVLAGCDPALIDGLALDGMILDEGAADASPADLGGGGDARPRDLGGPGPDALAGDASRDRLDAAVAIDGAVTPDAAPDGGPGCVEGSACRPIVIGALPYTDRRDTRDAPAAAWEAYACAPATDEGGGEIVYRIDLEAAGRISVEVDDVGGDAVDVDVHLLTALDPAACVDRDNVRLEHAVEPGRYFIVADTWVNAAGEALAGPYTLRVAFEAWGDDRCATREEAVRMAWRACDPGLDCFEGADDDGRLARFARLPSAGPVVKEAHLVTVADDGFAGAWPSASRDGLEAHYRLSEAATGYVMQRREPWAPEGEGGSRWGQSAYSRPLPVIDEAWYVNMFWSPRPAAGTRMIVRNPHNGRAVVAAAGYETGPGSNTALGGVSEEIHHHLQTSHRDVLELGFAVDQALPLGPIQCD